MINRFFVLGLMALILITNTVAYTLTYKVSNDGTYNYVQCILEDTGDYDKIYSYTEQSALNSYHTSGTSGGTDYGGGTLEFSNRWRTPIDFSCSNPNNFIVCYVEVRYEGEIVFSDSKEYSFYCSTPTPTTPIGGGRFGNITTGNNTNISQINYGTLPYNITGNLTTTTKILGLDKTLFFKVAALIILTILATSIKPIQIGLIALFFGINFFTDVLGVLTFPATLIILIMLLMLLEIIKSRRYR